MLLPLSLDTAFIIRYNTSNNYFKKKDGIDRIKKILAEVQLGSLKVGG